MTNKQKIKKIIKILIIMFILTISCVFYKPIDKFFISFFNEKFNVIFKQENLIVHYINVGQGDAIAVNLPNGEVLLIDAGPLNSNVAYTNYLKEKVLNASLNNNVDYLILTHADSDHCAGTRKLLNEFNVEKIYLPTKESSTQTYTELLTYINNNCTSEVISRELSLSVDGCIIEIMGLYDFDDTNESSAVLKLSYMNKSFLFMADVSSKVETLLINEYGNKLDCDVLKVAHHGSKTSTSLEFLEIVTPEYSVISVGQNSYGHPTQIVLNNLQSVNSRILRTDRDDNIIFTLGESYDLKSNYKDFNISGFLIDYRIFVLVVDGCLIFCIIIIALKKLKNKHITNYCK